MVQDYYQTVVRLLGAQLSDNKRIKGGEAAFNSLINFAQLLMWVDKNKLDFRAEYWFRLFATACSARRGH